MLTVGALAGCGGDEIVVVPFEQPATFSIYDSGPVPAEPCPALFAAGDTTDVRQPEWADRYEIALEMSALRTLLANPDMFRTDLDAVLADRSVTASEDEQLLRDPDIWARACDGDEPSPDDFSVISSVLFHHSLIHSFVVAMITPFARVYAL